VIPYSVAGITGILLEDTARFHRLSRKLFFIYTLPPPSSPPLLQP